MVRLRHVSEYAMRADDLTHHLKRPLQPRSARWPTAIRALALICSIIVIVPAAFAAEAPHFAHGVSDFGNFKYPEGFAHFDYVNPDAPKGGILKLSTPTSFNSFTPIIPKGIRPPGTHVIELSMLYDPLFWPSDDEPGSFYGNLVESVAMAPDYTWAIFRLRPEARWHDGVPVTARDVQFTFDWIEKDGIGGVRQAFQFIERIEILAEREIKFYFRDISGLGPNQVMVMGKWPIVPEHYWRARDMTKTTLEPPLGSGPYRIAEFKPGEFILYERVPDYWGRDLGIHRGRHNFDYVRYEVYRDATVLREALRKGLVDYYAETEARHWASGYDIPARDKGWLVQRRHNYLSYVGFQQALALNTRQEKLADRRVREALTLMYDYEWVNRVLHHGVYERPTSYFSRSHLAASGTPTPAEKQLLEPFRASLPSALFDVPFNPVRSTGIGYDRKSVTDARELMKRAGWQYSQGALRRADGEIFSLRFVVRTPTERRLVLPYVKHLRLLGIQSTIRMVESAQFVNLMMQGEFDVTFGRFGAAISPESGMRGRLHSAGSSFALTNAPGINHPAVDALLQKVLGAASMEELKTATHALDRVLLWNYYYIPIIGLSGARAVYWDKFGRPERDAKFRTGFPDAWWWDEGKASRIGGIGTGSAQE